ncbi:MAG: D-tyrosyl-tRNA(Tyr) deacylase [Opitutae bacterium]|nr:D-tyrosyl-tRNA(Tyr) deacylase [Opitutae bacterium]
MRCVLQRVSSASVTIDGAVRGAIERGLLVLLGVAENDTAADAVWLAQKIAKLRIFPDDADLMNRSVVDVQGGVLVISQFTLLASTRKGTRPSFNDAAKPDAARALYEQFLVQMETALGGRPVSRGEFGAMMQVALVNDGPVTLILDTRQRDA